MQGCNSAPKPLISRRDMQVFSTASGWNGAPHNFVTGNRPSWAVTFGNGEDRHRAGPAID